MKMHPMNPSALLLAFGILLHPGLNQAAMQHAGMAMDAKGMIMNSNPDKLPKDCEKISDEVDLTVHAGQKHARKFSGLMFAYDRQQWQIKPCSRVNITFVNDDDIRHQFMVHGLPGYLYPKGMFTIEVNGSGKKRASLIFPKQRKTYLVHCDISQHTEKGMKAQFKVGGGDKDLPSIPGLTAPVTPDHYAIAWSRHSWLLLVLSFIVGLGLPLLFSKSQK